jgi:hypothetical protein
MPFPNCRDKLRAEKAPVRYQGVSYQDVSYQDVSHQGVSYQGIALAMPYVPNHTPL